MDLNIRNKTEEQNQGAAAGGILLVVMLCGVFLCAPGMAFLALIRTITPMDRVQMWLFSAIASALIYTGLHIGAGPGKAIKVYLLSCASIILVVVLAKWGVHANWPDWVWAVFTQSETP